MPTQGQSSGPSTPPSLRCASAAAHAQGAAEARSASHPAPTSGNRAAAGLHRARRCVAGVLRPRSQQRCAMGQKRLAAQAGLGQAQRNRARVPPSTNTLSKAHRERGTASVLSWRDKDKGRLPISDRPRAAERAPYAGRATPPPKQGRCRLARPGSPCARPAGLCCGADENPRHRRPATWVAPRSPFCRKGGPPQHCRCFPGFAGRRGPGFGYPAAVAPR